MVILGILSSNAKDVGMVISAFIAMFISLSKSIFLSPCSGSRDVKRNPFHTQLTFVFVLSKTHLDLSIYTWIAIYSLYNLIRRSQPNNEYTSLIEDNGATGNPIYTRAWSHLKVKRTQPKILMDSSNWINWIVF